MPNNIQTEYNLKFKDYMREGINKYKGIFYDPYSPPIKFAIPKIFINSQIKKRNISFLGGRLKVHEGSGEYRTVLKMCRKLIGSRDKIKILDIGCANCDLADYLKNGYDIPIDYYGVDISAYSDEYSVAEKIDQVKEENFDIIVMTHVAEHLTLDDYIENFQPKLAEKLKSDGFFVFAVPNPLNPKNYFCDLTHIQKFPWHQTYALLRFSFSKVDVIRMENLSRMFDIIFWPLRSFTTKLVGLDTAGTLLFICRK